MPPFELGWVKHARNRALEVDRFYLLGCKLSEHSRDGELWPRVKVIIGSVQGRGIQKRPTQRQGRLNRPWWEQKEGARQMYQCSGPSLHVPLSADTGWIILPTMRPFETPQEMPWTRSNEELSMGIEWHSELQMVTEGHKNCHRGWNSKGRFHGRCIREAADGTSGTSTQMAFRIGIFWPTSIFKNQIPEVFNGRKRIKM